MSANWVGAGLSVVSYGRIGCRGVTRREPHEPHSTGLSPNVRVPSGLRAPPWDPGIRAGRHVRSSGCTGCVAACGVRVSLNKCEQEAVSVSQLLVLDRRRLSISSRYPGLDTQDRVPLGNPGSRSSHNLGAAGFSVAVGCCTRYSTALQHIPRQPACHSLAGRRQWCAHRVRVVP